MFIPAVHHLSHFAPELGILTCICVFFVIVHVPLCHFVIVTCICICACSIFSFCHLGAYLYLYLCMFHFVTGSGIWTAGCKAAAPSSLSQRHWQAAKKTSPPKNIKIDRYLYRCDICYIRLRLRQDFSSLSFD